MSGPGACRAGSNIQGPLTSKRPVASAPSHVTPARSHQISLSKRRFHCYVDTQCQFSYCRPLSLSEHPALPSVFSPLHAAQKNMNTRNNRICQCLHAPRAPATVPHTPYLIYAPPRTHCPCKPGRSHPFTAGTMKMLPNPDEGIVSLYIQTVNPIRTPLRH